MSTETGTEREYECRACGQPFRTRKTGKGVFYCHRLECDERRARGGIVTPNTGREMGVVAKEAAGAS